MAREMVKLIGLTGPTGAGKSTAASVVAKAGVPVISADVIARETTEPGSPVLSSLAAAFGNDILRPDGTLDRGELGRRAFASAEGTRRLCEITHPPILAEIRRQAESVAAAGRPLALLDAPLLFESGADALCQTTIAILADQETRRRRIIERDGLTGADADIRMGAQPENDYYTSRADVVIWNRGNLPDFTAEIKMVMRRLIGDAGKENSFHDT